MTSLLLNPHQRPGLTRSHCWHGPTPQFQDILEQPPPCTVFTGGDGGVCQGWAIPSCSALFLPLGTSGKQIFSPERSQIFCWLKYDIDRQKFFHLFCSMAEEITCTSWFQREGWGGSMDKIFRLLCLPITIIQLSATWLVNDRRPVFVIYSFTEVTLFILASDELQVSS